MRNISSNLEEYFSKSRICFVIEYFEITISETACICLQEFNSPIGGASQKRHFPKLTVDKIITPEKCSNLPVCLMIRGEFLAGGRLRPDLSAYRTVFFPYYFFPSSMEDWVVVWRVQPWNSVMERHEVESEIVMSRLVAMTADLRGASVPIR